MPDPLAKAGEWITCPNGHRFARFARDAYRNDVVEPEMFDAYGDQITPLKLNDLFGMCPRCGGYFVGTNNPDAEYLNSGALKRGAILVEGKWRG